ncbi:MAG: condensation domain-containing protein [Leptolyngbyaceae cyanobacterium]
MAPNQELYQRVKAFSPKQREALAQRLNLAASNRSARLVAYVVSADGKADDKKVSALRDRLKAKLPNYMVPAVIMPLAQMPRTANGKIDTKALPEPQLVGTMTGASAAPRTPAEQVLAQIWSEVLRLDTVGIHDNFFELGGDSILSIQIVSRAREAGLRLAPNQLFEHPTVAELAAAVNLAPEVTATQDLVTGEVPLTPIQHWFFEQEMEVPNHWHQAMLIELPDGVDKLGDYPETIPQSENMSAKVLPLRWRGQSRGLRGGAAGGGVSTNSAISREPLPDGSPCKGEPDIVEPIETVDYSSVHSLIERTLAILWTHHDGLRMRFLNDQQINADAGSPPKVIQVDLSHLEVSEQIKAIADHGSRLHANVNLADGDLMGAILFTRGAGQSSWLLLSLHHLIVDAVSWQILLDDLSSLLRETPQLPEKTTSFQTWAKTLNSQTPTRESELDFWIAQSEQLAMALPRDFSDTPPPTEGTTQSVTVTLSAEDTEALLKTVPAVYNTQINDALLTALTQTLLQWSGTTAGNVRIEMEAHGREQIADGIDLSRTVGWFTTTYPVSLHVDNADDSIATLKSVKEQLRQVPNRGIGYGMLRYLGEDATRQQLSQAESSEVLFNYLGRQDLTTGDLRVIPDIDVGTLRDSRNRRSYPLEINAWIAQDQLRINWRYDTQIHRSETLSTLANQYLSALKSLIAQCTDNSGGFTPSDFPDADLGQADLDDFISQLEEV